MTLRVVDKPIGEDARTVRRCIERGGPTIEDHTAMCHLPFDHKGPHQCVTMVGDKNEQWWEWD